MEAECLRIADELFAGIDDVLEDCDDQTVNAKPAGAPQVNSVFALVTHIDGMLGFWGGSVVAGESIPRDRDAEFTATGTVEQARALVARSRERLPRWIRLALTEGIADRSPVGTTRSDVATATPEFVVLHMLRELAQHTGHLQICRDVVLVQPVP
ncbi:MAG: DUF664 domain-containing protein [Gordonia sp. (in: high G+C Gram-positive bacteria)]